MKICDLSLYTIELPFRFAFNHSLAKRDYSDNLIVKATIETSNGELVAGYGESIPRDYVTGETIEQAGTLIKQKYFPSFIDKYFPNAHDLADFLCESFTAFGLQERTGGAAWCALELALLDAACKIDGISVAQLLEPNCQISPHDSIKYGAVASLTNKKTFIALLVLFKLNAFSTVKLKLGKDLATNVERVKITRKIMGNNVILRVDANCAWSVSETIEFAQKVQEYNIASIEQPVKADDFEGIIQLASSIPQAIVLDESLCTINQAKNFVDKHIKVDFNIRISKMGGLIATNKIRNIAKQAGIACHLGAQVGESGILTGAGRLFALSKGPFVNHEGAANSFLLKHDLTKENLTFGYAGKGYLPSYNSKIKAGLGITVDEKKLHSLIKPVADIFEASEKQQVEISRELAKAGKNIHD